MFKDVAVLHGPRALWMLDDSSPYQDHSGRNASATGTNDIGAAVVAGAANSSIFTNAKQATFTPGLFSQGRELYPFTLECWILPVLKTSVGSQAVLSHPGDLDGLTVNGKTVSFKTVYTTTGTAECVYTAPVYMRMHIVAIHTDEHNQLYVNGSLVAETDISDDQYDDTFASADTTLVAGETASTQALAMNGVAVYDRALSAEEISQHYAEGVNSVPAADVVSGLGGAVLGASPAETFLTDTWNSNADWEEGYYIDAASQDDVLFAMVDDTDLTIAGTWYTSFPLDYGENTSIYGVSLDYEGKNVTVAVSLDGVSWTSAPAGQRVPVFSSGFDPTDEDLQIRVTFASGQDEAYLSSMTVTGYVTSDIPQFSTRVVTATGNTAFNNLGEPAYMRDDQGIYLDGTLTVSPDTADDAPPQRTVEVWVKRLDATAFTISTSGTQYRNGLASSVAPPIGEWVLMHVVSGTDITTSITLTGKAIVGQVAIYDTSLTAAQVAKAYISYVGRQILRVNSAASVAINTPVGNANIYAYDWAIQPSGA